MMTNKQLACARAFGLLRSMVEYGYIPVQHVERAKEIIAQYDQPIVVVPLEGQKVAA